MITSKILRTPNTAYDDITRKFSKKMVFVVPKIASSSQNVRKSVAPGNIFVKLSEDYLLGTKVCENKLVRSPRVDIAKFTKK